MMPLSLAQVGEENIIKRIGGSPEVKRHLENLGFVVGAKKARSRAPLPQWDRPAAPPCGYTPPRPW